MAQIFRITSIPDPEQSSLKLRFGDVRSSVFSAWEKLLNIVANMLPGSAKLSLCFHYSPDLTEGLQNRLKIWIQVDSEEIQKESIRSLIKNGPVGEFYDFLEVKKSAKQAIDWKRFKSIGEIIRKIDLVRSYVPKSKNHRIPIKPYVVIHPFIPNEENDYLGFDRLLSGLNSELYFEISIQPTDASEELKAIYAGIFNLGSVNEGVYLDPANEHEKFRKEYGFMRDHFAEEIFNEYQELAKNLRNPQLEFTMRIAGESTPDVRLAASSIAENIFNEGKYRILISEFLDKDFSERIELFRLSKTDINWQHNGLIAAPIRRLTRIASVNEITCAVRLPVASDISPRTIKKSTDPDFIYSTETKSLLLGDDMETGRMVQRKHTGTKKTIFQQSSQHTLEHRLDMELLKKHMFICGVPGSGKTTAVFNLLVQLYYFEISFLVIESSKTEYRILKTLKNHKNDIFKKLGSQLKIFTLGNENISPFRFNPFAYPEGISKDEHINNLMDCFKAAMPIPSDTPLPALIGKAIEELYEKDYDAGFPTMIDLVEQIRLLMDSPDLDYDSEVKGNLRTAIEVRLSPLVSKKRSIGKIFSGEGENYNIEALINTPVIIEMDSLNTDQSNLLTLFILTSLREYIKINRRSGSKLKHVVVLEEAHNVVGNIPSEADPDDPRKKASDYVCRMLAELRALGEGIIISDQLPSTVASQVIKNTGTKLTHRLTSMDDREEIGYTMLLGGNEIEDLARLRIGEAFYYAEGLYRPRRIRCINSNEFLGFTGDNEQPPDNMMLYELIETEDWFAHWATKNLQDDLKAFQEYLNKRLQRVNNYWRTFIAIKKEFDKQSKTIEKNNIDTIEIKTNHLKSLIDSEIEVLKSDIHEFKVLVNRKNKLKFSENFNFSEEIIIIEKIDFAETEFEKIDLKIEALLIKINNLKNERTKKKK